MKLYTANFSSPSRAILMVIRNLEMDMEIIDINFAKGENKTEEFLKINPLGQVPVLVNNEGLILNESSTIAVYLVSSIDPNSSLYPMNKPIQRALIDEMLHFDASCVSRCHVQILNPMIANSDPQIPDEKKGFVRDVLSELNNTLEKKAWFTGDFHTIADFFILSNLIVILCAGVRIESYKNLFAWYERCKKLIGFEENYRGGKMIMELLKKKNLPPILLD